MSSENLRFKVVKTRGTVNSNRGTMERMCHAEIVLSWGGFVKSGGFAKSKKQTLSSPIFFLLQYSLSVSHTYTCHIQSISNVSPLLPKDKSHTTYLPTLQTKSPPNTLPSRTMMPPLSTFRRIETIFLLVNFNNTCDMDPSDFHNPGGIIILKLEDVTNLNAWMEFIHLSQPMKHHWDK